MCWRDQLTGTFSVGSSAGYVVSGASILSPIDPGQSYDGLVVQLNAGLLANTSIKVGANSETIIFNPVDTNASGFTAPLPPITLTIADTLELPGMVYSQAWGDVHIITYNGLKYDFQASGDYVLAQSRIPGDNFQIQLELEPWFAGASVTTIHQVAIALGSDRVTFDWSRTNTVLVDGAVPSGLATDTPLALTGGTITEISPTMYKVDWATGETMTVSQGKQLRRLVHQRHRRHSRQCRAGSLCGPAGRGRGHAKRIPARRRDCAAAAADHLRALRHLCAFME